MLKKERFLDFFAILILVVTFSAAGVQDYYWYQEQGVEVWTPLMISLISINIFWMSAVIIRWIISYLRSAKK